MNPASRILAINGGSSSLKFALFDSEDLRRELSGAIEGIGQGRAVLAVESGSGAPPERSEVDAADHDRAGERLLEWISRRAVLSSIAGIGHRIVHGGTDLLDHRRVTPEVMRKLDAARPLDPAHLPSEIALIAAASRLLPGVPQFACFDTAFHRGLPRVAQLLPIPRAYLDAGVRRLGFHGLSYEYLIGALRRAAGDRAAESRVILAHLGSGASLAALAGGKPVDTTMGFTPAAGLIMGTRPGDLDPGLLVYLVRSEKMSAERLDAFVNQECGLKGVSGTTSNMKALEERSAADPRAAEAFDLFCYRAVQWIGAYAAVLGGLDVLVFSGGIGERSSAVRREICSRLEFLHAALDETSNEAHGAVISDSRSAVSIRVIPTDEEVVIARIVREKLKEGR
ncbi:MAG TPA: acetate/propionate family kinase [Thermoanaerobaculia bacterium]|jgi:acetate kinase